MSRSSGRRWTRDEALAVLSLYYQLPFGKMHSNNRIVQRLAARLGRTNSSVAMKLVNFASLDPEHRRRGVRGMSNVSGLDREVWDEFQGQWETLAQFDLLGDSTGDDEADASRVPTGTETVAFVMVRRGQSFFRRAVLAAYGSRCCITGIANRALVRASHIVPWAARSDTRLDPRNGLALNALHDAAFDRGLIAFSADKQLLLSRRLRSDMPTREHKAFFERYEGSSLDVPERSAPLDEHLAFHREHVFQN